jgi:FdhD protein
VRRNPTEGIVERAEQISSIEVIESELGVEVRTWVDPDREKYLVSRRRAIGGVREALRG